MKISKYLWVEENIRLSRWQRIRLKRYNKYTGQGYLICTAYNEQWLFEIVEGRYLSPRYGSSYLVGVASSKETASIYVASLINAIYNEGSQTYSCLKT